MLLRWSFPSAEQVAAFHAEPIRSIKGIPGVYFGDAQVFKMTESHLMEPVGQFPRFEEKPEGLACRGHTLG